MKVELWSVLEGTNPVGDFIDNLPEKARKKVIKTIELLEKYGTGLMQTEYMSKLHGYDLYELRIVFNNIYYRILLVLIKTTCYLLHMFIKKTPNTPQKEIDIALNRAKQLKLSLAITSKEVQYGF